MTQAPYVNYIEDFYHTYLYTLDPLLNENYMDIIAVLGVLIVAGFIFICLYKY